MTFVITRIRLSHSLAEYATVCCLTIIIHTMKKSAKSPRKISKWVFPFGGKDTAGNGGMKELLGGKGANLAEMAKLGMPVPPGFTITTEACNYYYDNKQKMPDQLVEQAEKALASVEKIMKCGFGDPENPLLLSIRSGARKSMPGMMETVLNVGLTDVTREGLIRKTDNPHFVYDSQRRLIQMYADVVMEKGTGRQVNGDGIRKKLDAELEAIKKKRGVEFDRDLSADDLKQLVVVYKKKVKEEMGVDFPEDPKVQLWNAVKAVFASWNGDRAIAYRKIEGIPHNWGTAVNVQAMVFGNMGDTSATGVGFSRNPATGDKGFYGEWLPNAQGEDVVAGIRTPNPVNTFSQNNQNAKLQTLADAMPHLYKELTGYVNKLEKHFHDMLDIEFTIQEDKLWMLQCRVGKRTGPAAMKMALNMLSEKLINKFEAINRVSPAQLEELLHPILDPKSEKSATILGKGLPAGPGGACGQAVFTAAAAVAWKKEGKAVILVREETNPEDVEGMRAAEGILTARGGMTSHAALVARGWGKCCIVGAGELEIHADQKILIANGRRISEGDWISLNGTHGNIYEGKLGMMKAAEDNPEFDKFMKLCDGVRRLKIRTNADTPEDAAKARAFGAEGIGLFRTEHMFYGKGSEQPLFLLRKMIMAKTTEDRIAALNELYPFVKADVKATLAAMSGLPVTIRTLDPPLHEFVPKDDEDRVKMAESLKITSAAFDKRAEELVENNPMMGHRGVRLSITYPEITEMQLRAIFEASVELTREGKKPIPEIMFPLVGHERELKHEMEIAHRVHAEVCQRLKVKNIPHTLGTMIEVPRACLTADKIAQEAEFFSFGTNDLTQMTFGFSRDDIGSFVPAYTTKRILPADPFQTIDQSGVGVLMEMAIQKGRKVKKDLKIGICGEHGGEPRSVIFCHNAGLNYVSCSPFRVPVARLAAAQAVIQEKKK